jgi:hypothetical protein
LRSAPRRRGGIYSNFIAWDAIIRRVTAFPWRRYARCAVGECLSGIEYGYEEKEMVPQGLNRTGRAVPEKTAVGDPALFRILTRIPSAVVYEFMRSAAPWTPL